MVEIDRSEIRMGADDAAGEMQTVAIDELELTRRTRTRMNLLQEALQQTFLKKES